MYTMYMTVYITVHKLMNHAHVHTHILDLSNTIYYISLNLLATFLADSS